MRFLPLVIIVSIISRFGFSAERVGALPEKMDNDAVRSELHIAMLYFDGGRYQQAREHYEALLGHKDFRVVGKFTPDKNRSEKENERLGKRHEMLRSQRQEFVEEAMFLHVRSLFELGLKDPKLMEGVLSGFDALKENTHKFEKPQYQRVSAFWFARTLYETGKYDEAIKNFKEFTGLGGDLALDSEVSWYLARCLIEKSLPGPGDTPQEEKKKGQWRLAASDELNRIIVNYPRSPHYNTAYVELMKLRMTAKDYGEVERLSESFAKLVKRDDPLRASALLLGGQALFERGMLDHAITAFENVWNDEYAAKDVRRNASYRLGLAYVRMARASGADRRDVFLRKSRRAFQNSVKDMGLDNPYRKNGIYVWSEVLLELKEYSEAYDLVQEILSDPIYSTRASYLAGIALRGLADRGAADSQYYDRAVDFFEVVIRSADRVGESSKILEAYKSLADLEYARGGYAAALLYYRQTRGLARELHDFPLVAASDIGRARTLVEIGRKDQKREEKLSRETARSLVELIGSVGRDKDFGVGKSESLAFRLRARELESEAGPENYDRALEILAKLRLRYSDRVRHDEMDLLEGIARFRKAIAKTETLEKLKWMDDDQVGQVMDAISEASAILVKAAQASPRGPYAAKTYAKLGEIHLYQGKLAFRLANRFEVSGLAKQATGLRHEGKRILGLCAEPLARAIKLSRSDPELRISARKNLGEAFLTLEEYDDARVEFQLLSDDPSTSAKDRVEATRNWAMALEVLGQKDEALQKLRPNVRIDFRSAIKAGKLLLEMQQTREAYRTYLEGVEDGRKPASDQEAEFAAELRYRAAVMALESAETLVPRGKAGAERARAADWLQSIARKNPHTLWAALGLSALGKRYLDLGKWQDARALAEMFTDSPSVTTRQAASLISARAMVKAGELEQAERIFSQAVVIKADDKSDPKLLRKLSAVAIREQANIARMGKEYPAALRKYGRVFAEYHDMVEESDLARIAAAEVNVEFYGRENGLLLAEKLLKDGHDRRLMHETLSRLRASGADKDE